MRCQCAEILESRTSMLLCHSAPVTVSDVFKSATDVTRSISLFQIIASAGRHAPQDTSLLQFIRQIPIYLRSGHDSNSSFSASLFLEVSFFLVVEAHPKWNLGQEHWNSKEFCQEEVCGWTCKRSRLSSTLQLNRLHRYPNQHYQK